ncbi:hypothetical protein KSC_076450 [Ktedonobacter sp. SOSP1-52]|nr:hypothetical protein KSC_076450 [Ktedonobacter sp. SOSP1-52]
MALYHVVGDYASDNSLVFAYPLARDAKPSYLPRTWEEEASVVDATPPWLIEVNVACVSLLHGCLDGWHASGTSCLYGSLRD